MRNGWNEEFIKCPYWKGTYLGRVCKIKCECVFDTYCFSIEFKNQDELKEFVNDFCATNCWENCPIAIINSEE